jgi:two-component system LytT family sensor kinase
MILRLARIFRHVLAFHDSPFSSVNEEISFLETYLEIEKVRFGERLQVNIDVQESIAQLSLPTLILQPLVENSIKHGLGPKVGVTHLTIRARKRTDYLELTSETRQRTGQALACAMSRSGCKRFTKATHGSLLKVGRPADLVPES